MLFSQLFFDGCTEAEVACSWLFKERLEKLDLSPKRGRAARSLKTEQIPFTNPAVQVRRAGTKTASRSSVGGGRPPSLCYHGCFLFFFFPPSRRLDLGDTNQGRSRAEELSDSRGTHHNPLAPSSSHSQSSQPLLQVLFFPFPPVGSQQRIQFGLSWCVNISLGSSKAFAGTAGRGQGMGSGGAAIFRSICCKIR